MKNKLKVLWFLVVPLSWFCAFELVKWVSYYPTPCIEGSNDLGLCIFLAMTGLFGSMLGLIGGVALAIHMQD